MSRAIAPGRCGDLATPVGIAYLALPCDGGGLYYFFSSTTVGKQDHDLTVLICDYTPRIEECGTELRSRC